MQRSLLFHPNPTRVAPRALGLNDVAEMVLPTADGQRLVAWYAPPRPGQPTLFYLHGNAGALVHRVGRLRLYHSAGYGVFMHAYRGFSGSTGSPSEAEIVGDALMAYDQLKQLGPSDDEIVVYGESLGTAVAVQVAGSRDPAGLVLESPFSSAVDVGTYLYPYLPVFALLRDRFDSVSHIRKVKAPILMMHGEDDRVVPARFGKKLFAAAPDPKTAVYFGGATHYTLYEHGAFDKVRIFLDAFSARQPPGTINASCGGPCAPSGR